MPSAKLLLTASALSFFGSLLVAAVMFPAGYDWRHAVMSSLPSPSENLKAAVLPAGVLVNYQR